jgi:hypothetical protein
MGLYIFLSEEMWATTQGQYIPSFCSGVTTYKTRSTHSVTNRERRKEKSAETISQRVLELIFDDLF